MLKYQQIAQLIEQKIIEDNMGQGEKLPSLGHLIDYYQVSKSTIVKALSILENRGVIYQIQGSGIFARKRKKKGYINMLENQGFTSDLENFNLSSKVVFVKIIKPTEELINNLNCSNDDDIYHIKRIRYINGQILCIEESFYLKNIVNYLNEDIVEHSIFHYVKDILKLNIGFSDKHFHVEKLSEESAQLLELKKGDPSLHIEELFYLTSGQAFDFSKTIYHYEHSQFFLQSSNF
ncbi:GntR family transcriptional regulator [Vagococcus fessus]|uniref:GntR family transcriptional regulator n=1 Tax=Vagococcus fessus TaxID=120370 RepID=A0A430ABK7_9ENTE|nr:GntR family transcriptional regulator [Vagococcus fessus]RSU04617.1 GntR family transcriptional regulator [Vagococcus fessus]